MRVISKKWQNFKTWNPVTLEVSMGIYVPCESADHLRVRCFAVLRSALLCASTLCYAESNDHWSLRVCPIPNLNLIPVVRLLARPALVMTLDWLLWAAHTISIGAASPLCSIFIHELERFRARAGFAREGADHEEEEARGTLEARRRASAYASWRLSSTVVAQSACASTNRTARS